MAIFGSGFVQPRGPGTIPKDFEPFGLPQMPTVDAGQIEMPQPKKRGGMFGAGKGNFGEIISAALNGFLASRGNPVGMAGLQMLHQRRNQAADEQTHQQRRQEGFDDWVKRQAWEIANKPQQGQEPHYFEDNAGNLMAVGPDGQPRMVHKDPLQWKLVPNGLGGVVPVNIQQLMGGQGQQALPQTLSDDDWQTEGGPMPQASGGFPRPR